MKIRIDMTGERFGRLVAAAFSHCDGTLSIRPLLIGLSAISLLAGAQASARAEQVKVYAAGSLTNAMKEIIPAANLPKAVEVVPTFGPAGKLRERIECGEAADLYLSADLGNPEKLDAAGKLTTGPVPFARNRMCVAGRKALGLTSDNVLAKMLQSDLKLATSTPVADPGGDYALAVFKLAEKVSPGAEATLTGKALHLLGSGNNNTMVPVGDHSPAGTVFLGGNADLLLYYCSGAAALQKEVPDIVSVSVADAIEPGPVYGMAVLTPNASAMRLGLFILSAKGQAILAKYGLLPVVETRKLRR